MQTRRIDKFTESSPIMIISSVQGIIFPLELSLPALRSLHRARELAFLLSLYFFIPSFLFSLRFKVVIFSRPPFFQPVPRFASLLIFFFGRSCAFVFEVQGLLSSSWIFSPDLSSSCTRVFYIRHISCSSHLFFHHSRTLHVSGRTATEISRFTSSLSAINSSVTFLSLSISYPLIVLGYLFHFQLLLTRELYLGYIPS